MTGPHARTPGGRKRARGIGVPFEGQPGPYNAVTDVPGVEVGYGTRIEGDRFRSGVTAIHPRGRSSPGDPCAAGVHSFNGNGEMTGTAWIAESGTMAGPVCLTNTHAIGVVHDAVIRWTVEHHPALADAWLLPVVAETWDGYLNDINASSVTTELAIGALETATGGALEEGSVGGGTGMNAYGFKGGSGTASRRVPYGDDMFTVGAFVQANFGSRSELVIAGVPVGRSLADDDPMSEHFASREVGSVIVVIATDAPLLPGQCAAFARRATLGIGRTGTSGSHFSGDLFLAVSTANPGAFTAGASTLFDDGMGRYDDMRFVPWGYLDPFYAGVAQATEEAVLNALVANDEMVGVDGHRTPALPRERVVELLRDRGVLEDIPD